MLTFQTSCWTGRLVGRAATILVLCIAAAPVSTASAAPRQVDVCRPSSGKVLVANSFVTVYRTGKSTYACRVGRARHRQLKKRAADVIPNVDVAGYFVAYTSERCPSEERPTCVGATTVRDARTGELISHAPYGGAPSFGDQSLVVTTQGAAAWVRATAGPGYPAAADFIYTVFTSSVGGKVSQLATGSDVGPSVALTRSGPNPAGFVDRSVPTLYWTKAGQVEQAPLQ